MPTFEVFEILEAFISLRRHVALIRASESKKMDFGHNQISVLYRLLQSNATMGELAEHTLSDKASMTRTVSLLEDAGYVKRAPDPSDRRIVNIELTPKGRQQARKAYEIRSAIGRRLEECLSRKERKELSQLIQKIVETPYEKKDEK